MIALLDLVVAMFVMVILILFITQVALPFVYGTPFFPQFRKETPIRAKLDSAERDLEETTEEVILREKIEEINRRKAQLKGKK